MNTKIEPTITLQSNTIVQKTVYSILFTISFTHLLNDMMQSVIPAIYPLMKENFGFSFTQIGMITFTFQLTASLLQPFVGFYTDRRPKPFSLAIGMGFTLVGLVALSLASSFYLILLSVSLIGIGSSVFHPESSRVAYLASGGKKGLAQSIFQLGGNAGGAIGPLLAALIVMPYGQFYINWFTLVAILAILVLVKIGKWYQQHLDIRKAGSNIISIKDIPSISKKRKLYHYQFFWHLCFPSFFIWQV